MGPGIAARRKASHRHCKALRGIHGEEIGVRLVAAYASEAGLVVGPKE